MKIWHVFVGSGRFLVRARTEEEAIRLASKEAKQYYPTNHNMDEEATGIQTDLSLIGESEVLDIDFS